MRRHLYLAGAILAAVALFAATASAVSIHKPKLGRWTTAGGGFTLQNGTGRNKGKVLLTSFHLRAESGGCPEPPVTATVVGKFPLKVFTRGGYSVWGVGRNVGGEAELMSAKVSAGGKLYSGSLKMIWDFAHVTTEVLGGEITFGQCTVYMSFAAPKK